MCTPMRTTAMTRESAVAMVWVMCVDPVLRGIDYTLGDGNDVTQSLTYVEKAAPLWFWGLVFLTAGFFVMSGLVMKVYEPVIVGAVLSFAVYVTLAAGFIQTVWARGWPPDGFRTPVMFAAFGVLWGIVALEMYAGRNAQREAGSSHADTRGAV